MLNRKVAIEHQSLNLGQEGVTLIGETPSTLNKCHALIGKFNQSSPKKIGWNDEVTVEHRDEREVTLGKAIGKGPCLVTDARWAPQMLDSQSSISKDGHSVCDLVR